MNPAAPFVVTTTAKDATYVMSFASERAARAYIAEELLWESTISVECPKLEINERGSFA